MQNTEFDNTDLAGEETVLTSESTDEDPRTDPEYIKFANAVCEIRSTKLRVNLTRMTNSELEKYFNKQSVSKSKDTESEAESSHEEQPTDQWYDKLPVASTSGSTDGKGNRTIVNYAESPVSSGGEIDSDSEPSPIPPRKTVTLSGPSEDRIKAQKQIVAGVCSFS